MPEDIIYHHLISSLYNMRAEKAAKTKIMMCLTPDKSHIFLRRKSEQEIVKYDNNSAKENPVSKLIYEVS